MKLTIEHKPFLDALKSASGVIERRVIAPIMANVLISTDGDGVYITGSDLDSEVRTRKTATIETEGCVTVEANVLTDIVAKLDRGKLIELHTDGDMLHLKSGRSKFKLRTLPADDFPEMTNRDYEADISLESAVLGRIMSRCKVSMSNEETRYYLNGVAMQADDKGGITFVSTDGHRLIAEKTTGPKFPNIIIPSKAVLEIEKLCGNCDDVMLSVSENTIKLVAGDTVFTSKTIGGTFPEWSRVVPQWSDSVLTASATDLAGAAERVATVATERTKVVKLEMAQGSVTLSVGSGDNSSRDTVESEWTGNDGAHVGINARYLADMLKLAEKGDIQLSINSANEAVGVRFDESPDTIAVCMPMRV